MKLEFTKLEFLVNIQHIHLQIVPFIFPSPKIMTFSLGGRGALVCAKVGRVKPAKSRNTQRCREFSQLQRVDEF